MESETGVIVVGSLHYDIFLTAPNQPTKGEIVVGNNWIPKFGGKGGNQAIAASSCGILTKMVSAVGKDVFGKFIIDHLKSSNLNYDFVKILNKEKTGMSVAISDNNGEYGAVIVSGANLNIDPKILENSSLWNNCKILMIQNEVKEEINILAAKNAKLNGLKVCLNASPPMNLNPELIKNIDILIVNIKEAEIISSTKISNIDDVKKLCKKLTDTFKIVIITAGEEGVVACEKNKETIYIPSIDIEVQSTHGAGDVFAGVFCASIASKEEFLKALEIANKKAAFHVAK